MRAKAHQRTEDELGFSRIVAFSDGVFAIAITLLVLQLEVPARAGSPGELWEELTHQNGDLLAYAISFVVIGRFWLTHHRFFGAVRSFDGALLGLNIAYLAFVVLVPFSSQVLGEYSDEWTAVAFYAANLSLVMLFSAGLCQYVLWRGHALTDRADEVRGTRDGTLYAAAVFAFSIPIAPLSPGAAMLFWLLNVLDPTQRARRRARA